MFIAPAPAVQLVDELQPQRLCSLDVFTLVPLTNNWVSVLWNWFNVFPLKLIAECEQVKTERETELISEQVLITMSEMGLDRERTIQVGCVVSLLSFAIRSKFTLGTFFFYSPYKRTSTITTAPSTVCWRTASRNTRLCLLSCPRHAPLAILSMPYRYIVSVGMSSVGFLEYPYLNFYLGNEKLPSIILLNEYLHH